jgi:hypothetical protein
MDCNRWRSIVAVKQPFGTATLAGAKDDTCRNVMCRYATTPGVDVGSA